MLCKPKIFCRFFIFFILGIFSKTVSVKLQTFGMEVERLNVKGPSFVNGFSWPKLL